MGGISEAPPIVPRVILKVIWEVGGNCSRQGIIRQLMRLEVDKRRRARTRIKMWKRRNCRRSENRKVNVWDVAGEGATSLNPSIVRDESPWLETSLMNLPPQRRPTLSFFLCYTLKPGGL